MNFDEKNCRVETPGYSWMGTDLAGEGCGNICWVPAASQALRYTPYVYILWLFKAITSIYREGKWRSEKLLNLPKMAWLVSENKKNKNNNPYLSHCATYVPVCVCVWVWLGVGPVWWRGSMRTRELYGVRCPQRGEVKSNQNQASPTFWLGCLEALFNYKPLGFSKVSMSLTAPKK